MKKVGFSIQQRCTVAHNCHGKIIFCHGKIILATAKSFWTLQNHFGHGKIILATAKSFSSWQNHFGHGKIIFVTAKSLSTATKSFSTKVNIFCTQVTTVRKVWELINYGGQLTRSFVTRRRCFAQTVQCRVRRRNSKALIA